MLRQEKERMSQSKVSSVNFYSVKIIALFFIFSVLVLPTKVFSEEMWVDGETTEAIVPELKNLPSFAPAVSKLGESVVNIQTEGKEEPKAASPFGSGSPYEQLFQFPKKQKRKFSSLGSGFVIHPDGLIVTNHHVVDRASTIKVSFRDETKTYDAELIGSDPKTDLALIKVEYPKPLPAVALGNSDALQPGDWVIAIGNPFRLGHTATVGIVSAKHRRINAGGSPQSYTDFIQTDASINPGNSGGPLFDASGNVVGVNTAIFSPGRTGQGGFNIGIGFAIPINLAKGIIKQLSEDGKVVRGWLGVLIQPVTEEVAQALELDKPAGALVAQVMPDSPAAKAKFSSGDVIVEFDGKNVEENEDLPLMVADTAIGKKVKVKVIRDGKEKTLSVEIRELKDGGKKEEKEPEVEKKTLGLSVQELTEEIARALDVEVGRGVVVTSVEPESPGANAQLKRGDIILDVGSKAVNSVENFSKVASAAAESGKPVLMLVKRGGNTLFFTLTTDE